MNLETILSPFKDLESLIKAVLIFIRFNPIIEQNYHLIILCIEKTIKVKLSLKDVINFHKKITTFEHIYPIAILKDIENFQNECNQILQDKNQISRIVISENKLCICCKNSLEHGKFNRYNAVIYFASKKPGNNFDFFDLKFIFS